MARPDYEKVDHAASDDSENETLPRTSGEVRRHDHDTLTAEEEAEQLLAPSGGRARRLFGRGDRDSWQSGRSTKKSRAEHDNEKRELLYDTEEGGRGIESSESSESSRQSSELDLARLGEKHGRRTVGQHSRDIRQ